MFVAKPERILTATYPNETLMHRLKNTHIADANIPEHEFLQFRRLQSLIYNLRLAGYDIEAMQTEAFIGAVLHTYVNCKVAITRCEYDFEINDAVIQNIGRRLPRNLVWFTTNANINHHCIKALPIGITDYCGYTPY
jgi:hypothetical protein